LKTLNTISAHIPGSHAAKIKARNEIRAYMGYYGLPHVYLTMNPNASDSPIFQVMVGDDMIDLSDRWPELKPGSERAKLLAADPVAGADFFEFCIETFLEVMLGWDHETGKTHADGGLLGHLEAYYGIDEFTNRGQLHIHLLIWLCGGLNPGELHERLEHDEEFRVRFF
ncbi:hypothetical protein SISSUDRAFT_956001, partial [Sistotremastrum suecicum HHB10207 ss-3]